MRIATMNIQNLFHRDLSFLRQNASKNLQDWMEEFQALLKNPNKQHQDLGRMRELAFLMGFSPQATEPFLTLRRKCGHLYVKPLGEERQTRATERVGWNGWVELRTYPLDEKHRSAKVGCIAEADPDILVLQEVEDRPSLSDFNRNYLGPKLNGAFEQWLFTEGNDNRGLGHAILTRNGYRIVGFQPHAHEQDQEGEDLFEMDCPEYTVVTPAGKELTIISARFQQDGQDLDLSGKRKEQAQKVRSYCDRLLMQGKDNIVVCGTLGEVSYGDSLRPLLGDKKLRDIPCQSICKIIKGRKGTEEKVSENWLVKHDYLLSSGALYFRVRESGLCFPTISQEAYGSKPPLLWFEFGS
ncbi:hypothetical protein K1F50_07065 [Muricauda oceani]|uniref:Endonuclease/exonuclease/phosphatase family protein n=1 Tax=Flagellimonas oceani TaxID=2698672 RepID=A0A6G7J687_9FLAO|nr:hypothetical protein [Allomuricauda oceani]MBW8242558.1 hypothetical protein [Allomuricauda oceani]QII46316.1 hypothetical protein GVT53_17050 [Allomuricauda oceani]